MHKNHKVKVILLVVSALCPIIVACGSPDPVAYSALASSSHLAPNPKDETGRTPYRYVSKTDWKPYKNLILEPVEIYHGKDQQFSDMSEQDKSTLAHYMQQQFSEKLSRRFTMATASGRNTLRVKLTLTGATITPAVLGTLSHLDIAGGVYNGVQGVSDKEGTLTGSVSYAVEIYDAPTNRLLAAFISKQYPNAMNIAATMEPLEAAKVGIEKGADVLLEQLSGHSAL